MNKANIEHQLRQIKRRRIEIRSTKATLDLEDLELENRESQLESIVESEYLTKLVSVTTAGNKANRSSSRSRKPDPKATSELSRSASASNASSPNAVKSRIVGKGTLVADVELPVRKGSPETPILRGHKSLTRKRGHSQSSHISIEDDSDDVVVICDRPISSATTAGITVPTKSKKRKGSPLQKPGTNQPVFSESLIEKQADGDGTTKRSKVVILKVPVDPKFLIQELERPKPRMSTVTQQNRPQTIQATGSGKQRQPSARTRQLVLETFRPFASSTVTMSPVSGNDKTIPSNFRLDSDLPSQVKRHLQPGLHSKRLDAFIGGESIIPRSNSGSISTPSSTSSTSTPATRTPSLPIIAREQSTAVVLSLSPSPIPTQEPDDQECHCNDRDPDCRRCRGTPAALVESRSFLAGSSPLKRRLHREARDSQSLSLSLLKTSKPVDQSSFSRVAHRASQRTILSNTTKPGPRSSAARKQVQIPGSATSSRSSSTSTSHNRDDDTVRTHLRSRPGPSTYLIPDFEEMTVPEQNALEVRFCRRVLEKLSRPKCADMSSTDPDFLSRVPPHILNTILQHLHTTLNPSHLPADRPRPRAHPNNNPPPMANKHHFTTKFTRLIDELTLQHPDRCCHEPVIQSSSTNGPGRIKPEPESLSLEHSDIICWGPGMRSWVTAQMVRCDECVEACVYAVNARERTGLVDDWEI